MEKNLKRRNILSLGERIKGSFLKSTSFVVYCQVPFDIWKHFFDKYVDAKTLTFMMRTCRPFYELIKQICENNVRVAWECRKKNQIALAKKWLLACVDDNNNTEAMFHLGFALKFGGGWGLKANDVIGLYWLRRAAKYGNTSAMACCYFDYDNNHTDVILASGNAFAIGYWYLKRDLGINKNKAIHYFRISAEQDNNEYGQYYLGCCLKNGIGHIPNCDLGISDNWYMKSADNGLALAQKKYSEWLLYIVKCAKDDERYISSSEEEEDDEEQDDDINQLRIDGHHYYNLALNQHCY